MFKIGFAIIALTAVLAAAPADAATIQVNFTGTITSKTGNSFVAGNTISGQFIYSSDTSAYVSFTVGGLTIQAPFTSLANFTPDQYSALYEARNSAVQQGSTVNRSFKVDLEGVNQWKAPNTIALLGNTAQIASNLDTINNPADNIPSTFDYYIANADGTNVNQVQANLTGLSIVPEPASLMLLGTGTLALFARRRRA